MITKIAYILTTFPCRTETFALREIQGLQNLGFDIAVLAASAQQHAPGHFEAAKILYRPSLFSTDAVLSIGYILLRYPLALTKLICLTFKLIISCRREAFVLMANLHTIGFFARYLDGHSIFHIHAYFLNWPALIGLALAKITDRPLSIAAHARDTFVEHGDTELKVSHAKFVVTCTQQGLKYLKDNLPARYYHKLHLKYHGTTIASGHLRLHAKNICVSKHNNTIIAVGRLVRKKGFANLLKAFALVVREKPFCRLMILGDGPEQKKLSLLVEELKLKGHVQFLGWQDHNTTLRLIKQAAALIVPSVIASDGDRDGIPNVLLEAFACGVPVIASNLEAISEAVKHKRTGLLVAPGDVTGLASAIKDLLNDKDLQRQLSQKAHEMAIQRFDSAKNIEQLSKLFIRTIAADA